MSLSFLCRQVFVHPPPLPANLPLLLQGKTILITGSTSGIGLAAARECVQAQCGVLILAARSITKGESVKASLRTAFPASKTQIEVWRLDMESFGSVAEFGVRIAGRGKEGLHVAMLNAGVFPESWEVLPENGWGKGVMVNHLATAMLTLFVLPALRDTARKEGFPTRMTVSSSEVHAWTPFKQKVGTSVLEAVNEEKMWNGSMDHYSVTKLLNIFWTREFARNIEVANKEGVDVVVNMINPGSVDTGLHRDSGSAIKLFDRVIGRTPDEGGRLLIDAAIVKGPETHGEFLSEAKIFSASKYVRSKEGQVMQEKVWKETIGVLEKHMAEADLRKALDMLK